MLKDILARIDIRLEALGLKESVAAKKAGLSDSAIRDMRRALNAGKEEAGVNSTTLFKLAAVLETTPGWLLTGEGPEVLPKDPLAQLVAELRAELADTDLADEPDKLFEKAKRDLEEGAEMLRRLRR